MNDAEEGQESGPKIISTGWERLRCAAAGRWRDLRAAAGFLTLLPAGTPGKQARQEAASGDGFLASAVVMFPLVGAAVGMAAGAVLLFADALGLPPLAAAFVALAALVVLTGALHEDGLADVADGFGGGRTPHNKLRIMQDSRIGTYGVVAVVFSLGLRAAAVAALPAVPGAAAMIAAAALSRAMLPAIMRCLPPARPVGMSAEAGRPQVETVVVAVIIGGLVALIALGPVTALLAAASAGSAAAAVALLARQQIGGHTGDVCGAAQQTAEVAALLAVLAWR